MSVLSIWTALIFVLTLQIETPQSPATSPGSTTFERLLIRIPKLVTPAVFERYCDILNLSEPQRLYSQAIFQRYQERMQQVERTWASDLNGASLALQVPGPNDRARELAYTETMSIRDAIDNDSRLADEAMFSELDSLLSDAQRSAMDRVRMHRERDRSPLLENKIYESVIDLSALVEQCDIDNNAMNDVDASLWEYEQAVTPKFVERDQMFRELLVPSVTLYFRLFIDDEGRPLENSNSEHLARRRTALKERSAVLDRLAKPQRQIAKINREFLPRVLEKLPPDASDAVEQVYKMTAWEYVYPDTATPAPLHRQLTQAVKSDGVLVEAINEMWSIYQESYQDLCAKAQTINEQIEETIASTGTTGGVPHMREEIADLMWKRIDLNKRVIESITSILPAEFLEANRAAIHAFELQVQRARPPKARYDAGLAPNKKPPENSEP